MQICRKNHLMTDNEEVSGGRGWKNSPGTSERGPRTGGGSLGATFQGRHLNTSPDSLAAGGQPQVEVTDVGPSNLNLSEMPNAAIFSSSSV